MQHTAYRLGHGRGHRLGALGAFTIACAGVACTGDSSGNWCAIDDLVGIGDETFCPEADAPEKCDDLVNAMLAAYGTCAEELGIDDGEEQLRRRMAQDGLDFEAICDTAIATGNDYDDCLEAFEEGNCDGAGSPIFPENACDTAVLIPETTDIGPSPT